MVNLVSPVSCAIESYNNDTLFYYLNKYNVEYISDKNLDGFIVFEPVHMADIRKIPNSLTETELSQVKNGSKRLLLFFAREPLTYGMVKPEIDSLSDNGIDKKSILIVTGNFGKSWLSEFNQHVNAVPFFIFDMTTAEKYKGREFISEDPILSYLCFNNVVKLHRSVMNSLLPEEKGYISYLKRKYDTDEELTNEVLMNNSLPTKIRSAAIRMIKSPPKVLDLTTDECIENQFNDNYRLYDETAISVVTESLYCDKSLFLTEKTFKAILSMHPFIIASSPHIHSFLESFGYKNYDFLLPAIRDVDLEYDLYTRLTLITEEIINFDISQYHKFKSKIAEYANYNRNLCKNGNYKLRLENLLKEITNENFSISSRRTG